MPIEASFQLQHRGQGVTWNLVAGNEERNMMSWSEMGTLNRFSDVSRLRCLYRVCRFQAVDLKPSRGRLGLK